MLAACAPLSDLCVAAAAAFGPTLSAIAADPWLLLAPQALSRIIMAHVWDVFSAAVDNRAREAKLLLITPHARGCVLDVGAGHGHTIPYLDHDRVSRYIALEPNTLMHVRIRAAARAAGFSENDGSLLILPCGVQDTDLILAAAGAQVDTIISVLTLCSVPAPQKIIPAMADLLRPGGQLLYYEHVRSPRPDIAWWQRFWSPLWALAFDGCRIDRQTDLWIGQASGWRRRRVWAKPDEGPHSLFVHRLGIYEKPAGNLD